MTKQWPSWGLLVLVGVCSAVATAAAVRGVFARGTRGSPVAVVPLVVELGDHEYGKTVIGRFTVGNSGTADLLLAKFGTSCSCAAVEVENEGQARRAGVVRVGPGEQVQLIARVAVGGRTGTSQRVSVTFATNDPNAEQPIVELVIGRIMGGVATTPLAVVFGEQPVGASLKRRIQVFDNGIKGRRISAVRSMNAGRFSANLLPPVGEEARQDVGIGGRLIGIIEVVPVTNRAGPLDGQIEIQVADEARRPDFIDVSGQVVGPVVARPSALVLPRSAGGKLVYAGQVRITARDGGPVVVKAAPAQPQPGWSLTVTADPDTTGGQVVAISRSSASPKAEPFIARLNVTLTSGEVSVVEIPIHTRDVP